MDSLVFSSCRYGHKLYLVIFDSLFGNPDIRTQPVKLISLPLIE
jgi:hypothetical protein